MLSSITWVLVYKNALTKIKTLQDTPPLLVLLWQTQPGLCLNFRKPRYRIWETLLVHCILALSSAYCAHAISLHCSFTDYSCQLPGDNKPADVYVLPRIWWLVVVQVVGDHNLVCIYSDLREINHHWQSMKGSKMSSTRYLWHTLYIGTWSRTTSNLGSWPNCIGVSECVSPFFCVSP